MSSGTYISSPGVLNTSPTATTVYLLSSINDVGKEIIIRDVAPLTSGQIIVSTTNGVYFNRDISSGTLLSSFKITTPFDYITVASRTPNEYMLLQSTDYPIRANNQAFAPNFLQISTLSTIATTASNFLTPSLSIDGRIVKGAGFADKLVFSTVTASAYVSTGQLQLDSAVAMNTAANDINTATTNILYSAYTASVSTLANYTVLNNYNTGSVIQTGDLQTFSPITVGGTATYGSTLQANNARVAGATAFGSTVSLVSTLNVATTLSTLTSWTNAGAFYTSNYTAINNISTSSYNAARTTNTGKTYIGGSNTTATGVNTYVAGSAYVNNNWITPNTSTLIVSTGYATLSSINFMNEVGAQVRVRGSGTSITVNEVVIAGSITLATNLSTLLTTQWTSSAQYYTSTIRLGNPVETANPYAFDMRGDAFISSAFIMDRLAIYGGTNPTAFATPTFNTIYLSTNGMLVNNRLFVDHLQNRVGVNTTSPQYTLDVSGLIYQTSSIAYNIGGGTSWVIVSDSKAKENINHDINSSPYEELIRNLKLKEYTYTDKDGDYDIRSGVFSGGFASRYGLVNRREYGFLAQDVEFYFPNSVYEMPFYNYNDFHFLNVDQIMKAHYAVTRTMIDKVNFHSSIIGNRETYISTTSSYQNLILADLSSNIGAPFNTINTPTAYPNVQDWL